MKTRRTKNKAKSKGFDDSLTVRMFSDDKQGLTDAAEVRTQKPGDLARQLVVLGSRTILGDNTARGHLCIILGMPVRGTKRRN